MDRLLPGLGSGLEEEGEVTFEDSATVNIRVRIYGSVLYGSVYTDIGVTFEAWLGAARFH